MTWDIEQRGRYLAVKNYIRAALYVDKTKTMTFCAAATTTELYHVTEICSRWQGPVSVSVYAPGSDFKTALRKIIHLRLSDNCVHQNVTWHVYFDSEFSPPQKNLRSPEEEAELTKASPTYEMWPKGTFKSHGTLPFPANIGRNIALQESRTDYVLVSDLHYYPSAQIIPRFLKLLKFQGKAGKKVYVLPVFRMLGYGKPPSTKTELVEMISKSDIKLSSGTSDCSECNIFPNARKWLEVRLPDDSLSVYYVSHEKEEFKSWQPFYISQRNIPVFDEDQTKEG
ncbi:N-acetyllactosaminide beta-1,3-N-acetylglucosaminyltransferase, partial [Stegodyphus mimosarum]